MKDRYLHHTWKVVGLAGLLFLSACGKEGGTCSLSNLEFCSTDENGGMASDDPVSEEGNIDRNSLTGSTAGVDGEGNGYVDTGNGTVGNIDNTVGCDGGAC